MNITERPRRLRKNQPIRDALSESELRRNHLVWPVFVTEGSNKKEAIESLPGCYRYSPDVLLGEIDKLMNRGLNAVALFPHISDDLKNAKASEAVNPEGLIPKTIRQIKERGFDLNLITDVALDPYSSDGHDGLVKNGVILNDETLIVLSEQARVHAEAGADFVGPSDMMDGRVGWIRQHLDEAGYSNTGIISYTAKYASTFYGPFRDALKSAPKAGDKKTYQMDPRNSREALREARLDRREGADVLMVKPALAYLDIIQSLHRAVDLPIAAYNVSGEYAMVKAAAEKNWLQEKTAVLEILTSIRRAGASLIFSYHTPDALSWLS